jgi:hypothetical protein
MAKKKKPASAKRQNSDFRESSQPSAVLAGHRR